METIGSLGVGAPLGSFLPLLLLIIWWKRSCSRAPASGQLPLPPGTFGFLWVGETFKFLNALRLGDPIAFMRERTARFRSNTFKTRLFFHNTAVLQGVAANRFMAAAANKQQLISSLPASSIAVLGKHVPPAKHGAPHRRLRQIMASCLGPLALREHVGRVDLITHLHFETFWKAQSQQVFLLSLIKENFFRIVCSLLAGTEDEALVAQMYKHYKIWSTGAVSLPLDLPGTAFRRAKSAKKMLACEMDKLMDSKQQANADTDDPKADLLWMLMRAQDENGGGCHGREELQDVMHFLLLAGCESSSATLSFVLKCLEQNPACYRRLLQEHEAIRLQKNRGERLTWADVQNMRYTWAVIQETMRIRPVAFGVLKEAKQDLNFDGYRIPQGWKVAFDLTSTLDDQFSFPEPHKFDPSRFDIEKLQEGNGPPPYVFIPFGLGPHSCPGGDFARIIMSIYLHHLALSKLRWTSLDPSEKVHMLATLSLTKSYPTKLSFDKKP